MHGRLGHTVTASLAALIAVVALAACGSSKSSSGGGGSTSASSGATTQASSSGSGAANIAAAKKNLAAVEHPPASIGITKPLGKKVPSGMTVDFMQCGVPDCTNIGNGLEQALKVLGIKLVRVPVGNDPTSIQQGFNTAVQNKPDGVIVPGLGVKEYAAGFAALSKLHIPVISDANADVPHGDLKQVLMGPAEYRYRGKLAADWYIVHSNGDAHILYPNVAVFDFAAPLLEGFKAELAKNCPKCTVNVLQIKADDIGTQVPNQIVSYLQRSPSTNYLFAPFGSVFLGVPQALRAASLQNQVTLFSVAGEAPNFQYIKAGEQTADLALSLDYVGWALADSMARQLVGQDPAKVVIDDKLPWDQIIDKSNITWNISSDSSWPYIPGFRQQFEKLWGVS